MRLVLEVRSLPAFYFVVAYFTFYAESVKGEKLDVSDWTAALDETEDEDNGDGDSEEEEVDEDDSDE